MLVTVKHANGGLVTIDSKYDDSEAMIRLYDLTGYDLIPVPGDERIRWTGTLKSRFARDLVVQNEMDGRLSAKQWAWVHILVHDAELRLEAEKAVASLEQGWLANGKVVR